MVDLISNFKKKEKIEKNFNVDKKDIENIFVEKWLIHIWFQKVKDRGKIMLYI